MSKRFLVTGATGFIGSCLLRRLVKAGEEVDILVRESSDKWRIADLGGQVREHCADLRDEAGVLRLISEIRPEVVFHCAAYGAAPNQHDHIQLAKTNLAGTVNLVEALMKIGYECMVNTGSSAEYGLKARYIAEDEPLEPHSVYGATKAAATLFCQAVARNNQQPIITLRVFTPYGPYDEPSRLVPAVIRGCLSGQDVRLTSGREARDFFFVEDLVDLYMKIPNCRWSPGEVVNVGSGTQHSVHDVATKIIELTGAHIKPMWGTFPPRDFDTDFWVADATKARALFGWTAQVGLEEGLRRTIEWHRTLNSNDS